MSNEESLNISAKIQFIICWELFACYSKIVPHPTHCQMTMYVLTFK